MLSIIVATAENNAIGKDNKLLWHISDDLKRFKSITSGHKIFMGRKTFESLPGILPNRPHLVLTRDKDFSVDSDKVTIVNDLENFINEYKNSNEEIFIIGGGEIYKALLPHADRIFLTKVKKSFDADTFFPQINLNEWELIHNSSDLLDEKSGLIYEFLDFKRK